MLSYPLSQLGETPTKRLLGFKIELLEFIHDLFLPYPENPISMGDFVLFIYIYIYNMSFLIFLGRVTYKRLDRFDLFPYLPMNCMFVTKGTE